MTPLLTQPLLQEAVPRGGGGCGGDVFEPAALFFIIITCMWYVSPHIAP